MRLASATTARAGPHVAPIDSNASAMSVGECSRTVRRNVGRTPFPSKPTLVIDKNVKIFGIGLSRTGTVSLTKALTLLGIKAEHYPNDSTTQEELRSGNYRLSVLNNVQALTDIPVAPYYPQFHKLFPSSKFILTTRPTELWLSSVESHFRNYVEQRRDSFDDFVFACVYGVLHFNADRFRYVKELHEANVRHYFADYPEQLLIFNVHEGHGWKEICNFLDCPVPDIPYPHENRKLTSPARKKSPGKARGVSGRLFRKLARFLK
jgi:hypothetical protein